MSLYELTMAFWALCMAYGPPDMGAVQRSPEHQALASYADQMRDYAHNDPRPWDELPPETRVALDLVWGAQR